jgi:hypothetical protein
VTSSYPFFFFVLRLFPVRGEPCPGRSDADESALQSTMRMALARGAGTGGGSRPAEGAALQRSSGDFPLAPACALRVDLLIPWLSPACLPLIVHDRASARQCRHGWHPALVPASGKTAFAKMRSPRNLWLFACFMAAASLRSRQAPPLAAVPAGEAGRK